jgi:DNA adenine methylase
LSLYLQRLAFGGKVTGQNFGVDVGRTASFDLNKLGPMLAAIHERLAGVVIENLTWRTFIDRYDQPGTLFYLDPLYWCSEDVYGQAMFGRDHFEEMADRLASLRGRFILSINDVPGTRALFARYTMLPVDLKYGISAGISTQARELIVTG